MADSEEVRPELEEICQDIARVIVRKFKVMAKQDNSVQQNELIDTLVRVLKRKREDSANEEGDDDDDEMQERKRLATDDSVCGMNGSNVFLDYTAEEKVLRNPLVLSKIVDFLSTKDVLNCRLVSVTWKELFDNILSLVKSLQITFEYDKKYSAYFLKSQFGCTTTTLELLNKRLELVKTFPCVNFHFVNGNLATGNVPRFLQLYGQNIKKLGLSLHGSSNETNSTKLFTFRKLLVKHAPNVEYLHLEKVPGDWEKLCVANTGAALKPLHLPRLQVLKFSKQIQYHTEFLRKMLSAAVNLHRFETGNEDNSFTISEADFMVNLKKINLVRNVELHSITASMLPYYENFARSRPRLSRLSLCFAFSSCNDQQQHAIGVDTRTKLGKALTSIFKHSSKTMVDLTLDFPFALFPGLTLPILSNLKVLAMETKLSTDKNNNPMLLPKNLNFSRTFPSLQKVILDLSDSTSLQKLLPIVEQSLTVKKLQVSALNDPAGLVILSETFPNVEELCLLKIKEFSKIGKSTWRNFKLIRSLRLEVLVGYGFSKNSFPLVDSTFTGFTEGTCRILKDNPTRILDVKKERKDVSILDLKELEDLTVIFSDSACRTGTSCNLLTPVAGQFAFSRMPSLRVRIGAQAKDKSHQQQMKDALEIMSPYVNKKNARQKSFHH